MARKFAGITSTQTPEDASVRVRSVSRETLGAVANGGQQQWLSSTTLVRQQQRNQNSTCHICLLPRKLIRGLCENSINLKFLCTAHHIVIHWKLPEEVFLYPLVYRNVPKKSGQMIDHLT